MRPTHCPLIHDRVSLRNFRKFERFDIIVDYISNGSFVLSWGWPLNSANGFHFMFDYFFDVLYPSRKELVE